MAWDICLSYNGGSGLPVQLISKAHAKICVSVVYFSTPCSGLLSSSLNIWNGPDSPIDDYTLLSFQHIKDRIAYAKHLRCKGKKNI